MFLGTQSYRLIELSYGAHSAQLTDYVTFVNEPTVVVQILTIQILFT